jgi:hypothetical protein
VFAVIVKRSQEFRTILMQSPWPNLVKSCSVGYTFSHDGDVAKWQGKGLQNPHRGFNSHRRLTDKNGS